MSKKKEPLVIIIKPGPRALTADDFLFIRYGMTMQQFCDAVILNKDGKYDCLYKNKESVEGTA